MSTRYPIFLDLERKSVLIVGGGTLALQKLRTLEPTGAMITVVAPELRGEWPSEHTQPALRIVRRPFQTRDLAGHALVFAATDDADLNHEIVAAARGLGILANAVDDPAWCDFYTPAVVQRGRVTFAVSTDGGFPGVSRALREVLEDWLPEADDALVDALFAVRRELRNSGISPAQRGAALRGLVANFKAQYLLAAPSRPPAEPAPSLSRRLEGLMAALQAQHG